MSRHKLWLLLDNYKRQFFVKNEFKRSLLKSVKCNKRLDYLARYKASYYLSKYPRIVVSTYSSNRCIISGRVWSVNKRAKMSRFVFREQTYNSKLPGCSRASW